MIMDEFYVPRRALSIPKTELSQAGRICHPNMICYDGGYWTNTTV